MNTQKAPKKTISLKISILGKGQKAYCDGHTDKVVNTISRVFWEQAFFILQDLLCGL